MEGIVDISEFFRKLKFVCHLANPIKDFKWSNVSWIKLSLLSESDDTFTSLQALSNLYYLFSGFINYFWSIPGWVSNFLDDSDDEGESEEGVNEHDPLEHEDRSCGDDNEVNEVLETIFDESSCQKMKHSEDPFGIYPLLNKKNSDLPDIGTAAIQWVIQEGFYMYRIRIPSAKITLLFQTISLSFEIVIMGDFNEVRFKSDRFGSVFNVRGAEVFNSFIANAGLVEVPLGGSAFTWCHKSASKMSKIDRIAPRDKSNALRNLMYKLKFLKLKIRGWINMNKNTTMTEISRLKVELADLDEIINNGNGTDETVNNRAEILNSIHKLHQIQSTKAAQKAKIKWSVEGDGNVCLFHGIINKKRSQQNIWGVMVDGKWIEEPSRVNNQFFQHFKDRFDKPKHDRIDINMSYPRSLSSKK
nr:RNA-directed DNA polymerase, eukaryota [Tanacetum cinerariifolium]